MATERDLELLDDYLSNRLKGPERIEFERRLETDASLQSELALQRELIEGIRAARVAELKTMLNQLPVPPASGGSIAAKFAAWALAVAVVGLGGYYLWQRSTTEEATSPETSAKYSEEPAITDESLQDEQPAEETAPAIDDTEAPAADDSDVPAEQPAAQEETETTPKVSPPIQPDVTPYDPTRELETPNGRPEPLSDPGEPHTVESSIVVEVVDTGKRNDFHYQFKDGKLYLLGSFEKDLYEIMEFFNDDNKRTVFLYYNSAFYLLDETRREPTPLTAISDPELLQKLRKYRDR
ncbi:MAG: hypothetical protein LOY03_12395 [Cyclobacteriaceae bacterium]|nr:hypothetical protein [Cyclobacteriaceae bacterium]